MSPARRLIAIAASAALLCAVILPVALLTGEDDPQPRLAIERTGGGPVARPELEVALADGAAEARVAPGATTVGLECTDAAGGTVVRGEHPWPFPRDGSSALPHVHQRVPVTQLARVARCRLVGTDPPLEGAVARG